MAKIIPFSCNFLPLKPTDHPKNFLICDICDIFYYHAAPIETTSPTKNKEQNGKFQDMDEHHNNFKF